MGRITGQTEEWIWTQVVAGDSLAYEELVHHYYTLLYQYGGKFSRDKALVKDCIQDVFLTLWESRHALNAAIPPKPYLLASLRRRIHRVVSYDRLVFDTFQEDTLFDADFGIEDRWIHEEETHRAATEITRLLNQLPARQKEVIYLKFFQNLSREEIVDVMQITPQSVSNLLQKSFKWLREYWPAGMTLPFFLLSC
ncbi:MAG: sigma-70 family RNA polymerase sigma factor [Siphonobacter aquaeclarae]|nr:sigma-70 family RNA polymerase sigma factor [Siphonobacter aquaeclarae]